MANFSLGTGQFTARSLLDNESGFVGRDAYIYTIGEYGVSTPSPQSAPVSLTVAGTISALDAGAVLLNAPTVYMSVGTTGLIASQTRDMLAATVELIGNTTADLRNAGWISGDDTGVAISLDSIQAANANVTNTGTITAVGAGIRMFLSGDPASATVFNSGTITTNGVAISINHDDTTGLQSRFTLVNTGTIFAGMASVSANGGDVLIRNSGVLVGDITLGLGNDRVINWGDIDGVMLLGGGSDYVDNRTGFSSLWMSGEEGLDTFVLNPTLGETVYGGAGFDSVEFSGNTGAVVALDGSFANAGGAEGDSFVAVERLVGSNAARDTLRGDARANQIEGRGGADSLAGGAGSDILVGGSGADALNGGLAGDVFRFLRQSDLGDTISDFSNTTVNNDRMQFIGTSFGGLAAGVLAAANFVARADNLAQDADDRFVFRTTDRSVWYDADGNGAGAAVMVADLQDNATFTRFDIVIL